MKKLIALILAVLMILSFAACDKNEPDEPSNSSGTPSASNTPAESTGDPSNTDTPTNTDTPSNTDTPTNTDTPDETDGPDETDAPSNTDKPAPDDTPMAGFVINTEVYTTKYEDGKDVHLEGLDSGIYREPDRSTSCGSLKDGTEVPTTIDLSGLPLDEGCTTGKGLYIGFPGNTGREDKLGALVEYLLVLEGK